MSVYLVDLGEEAAAYQLGVEVFPELQLPDSRAQPLPAVHVVVGVRRLTIVLHGVGGL